MVDQERSSEDRELAYFMGRVDNQLGQIIQKLDEQRVEVITVRESQTQNALLLREHGQRLGHLEEWRKSVGDPQDLMKHSDFRSRYLTPVVVALLVFFLTGVVPALLALIQIGE